MGRSALHWLDCDGQQDAGRRVKALMDLAADVNRKDDKGSTPLAIAARTKAKAMIAALQKFGGRL
jgi:hypothetical protein